MKSLRFLKNARQYIFRCPAGGQGAASPATQHGGRAAEIVTARLRLFDPPCVRLLCRAESESADSVLGQLGGRELVKAGSIDPKDYFVKRVSKDDIEATFSRSQGAGGQNVNKVSTKADIRFDVKGCDWMSDKLKQAVTQRESGRMNKQGELLISSQVTRSQASNLDDAISRLQTLLDDAAESIKPIESDPKKVKQLAKRQAKAAQKRLDKKKKHSDKKKTRGKVGKGDW